MEIGGFEERSQVHPFICNWRHTLAFKIFTFRHQIAQRNEYAAKQYQPTNNHSHWQKDELISLFPQISYRVSDNTPRCTEWYCLEEESTVTVFSELLTSNPNDHTRKYLQFSFCIEGKKRWSLNFKLPVKITIRTFMKVLFQLVEIIIIKFNYASATNVWITRCFRA